MRPIVLLLLIGLAAGGLSSCALLPSGSGKSGFPTQAGIDRISEEAKPSIVRIRVVTPSHRQGREERFVSSGSGAIISPDGYVITNHHVAARAVQLKVTLANREVVDARLVGTDPATDIAVIQLLPEVPTTFPYLRFADSDQVRVGDPVLAMGSPLGVSQSVTLGVMSNTALVIDNAAASSFLTLDGESVGELVRWFAHDAVIFPGNSGGPLLDTQGRIIGINEISYGLGGAVPGNLARQVAMELIERGSVERAYTGLQLQPRLRAHRATPGVLVASVLPGSPAEAAGFQPGDLIVRVAGEAVDVRFLEDLPGLNQMMAALPIGSEVDFEIHRGGEAKTIVVAPILREPARPPVREVTPWGMTARDLTLWTSMDLGREGADGIVVTSVRPGGPLDTAKPPVRRGDVITRVEGRSVQNLDEFEAIHADVAGDAEEGRRTPVLVEFERSGQTMLTVVEVGIDRLDDPARDARRAWLPIETQVLTRELASAIGLEGQRGVRVTRVHHALAGEDFPLEVGDVVVAMDGMEINAYEPHHAEIFDTMVRQYRIGRPAELSIFRDGERHSVETRMLESRPARREMRRWRDLAFDFILREAAFDEVRNPAWGGFEPVVVVDSVSSGGWASLAGLSTNAAVVEIQGRRIESLDDARTAMEAVHEERPASVVMRVRRGVQDLFIEMEPAW